MQVQVMQVCILYNDRQTQAFSTVACMLRSHNGHARCMSVKPFAGHGTVTVPCNNTLTVSRNHDGC